MTEETIFTLPLDWNEWRKEWDRWRATSGLYRHQGKSPFRGKNFLADEILGVYRTPDGRIVELSEVTFPNLSERDERGFLINKDVRCIGLTFEDGGTVVHSFQELERELGL